MATESLAPGDLHAVVLEARTGSVASHLGDPEMAEAIEQDHEPQVERHPLKLPAVLQPGRYTLQFILDQRGLGTRLNAVPTSPVRVQTPPVTLTVTESEGDAVQP